MLGTLFREKKKFGGLEFPWPDLEKDSDETLAKIQNEWRKLALQELVGIVDVSADTCYRLEAYTNKSNA